MDVKIFRGNSHFGNTSMHHRPCLKEPDYLLLDIKPTGKSLQKIARIAYSEMKISLFGSHLVLTHQRRALTDCDNNTCSGFACAIGHRYGTACF